MKTLKTILAIVLALTLLCGCVPADNDTMSPNTEEPSEDHVHTDECDCAPDVILPDESEQGSNIHIDPDFEDDGGADLDEPPIEYTNQIVEESNDEFKLTLCNAKDTYTSDENIEIEATISLISGESLTVWSGDPILSFSLSGDTCFDNEQGSAMTMDILMSTTFTNAEDMIVPYQKTGGWSSSDPHADYYTYFFSQKDSFKLPAGNYTVTAYMSYSLDSDDIIGTQRTLKASVSFTVLGTAFEDLEYPKSEPQPEVPPQEEVIDDETDPEDLVQPLSNVELPDMVEYPKWEEYTDWNEYDKAYSEWSDILKQLRNVEGRSDGVDRFIAQSVKEVLLSDAESNTVYSPLNVYFALGMLAEITDGETRQQILDLVGADSIEELRTSVYALWCHNYVDDGRTTSLLSSSVWIDDRIRLLEGVGESLAQNYYAESYNCDIGSDEMLATYKNWLNSHTGGLLKDSVEQTKFDPETVLVLATTIYYKAGWSNEFNERGTAPDIFTLSDGTELECDFLNGYADGTVYYSDNFSATAKSLNDGGRMWFILPDQDVALSDVILGDDMMELVINKGVDFEREYAEVKLSLPKFDVKSDVSLNDALKNLGVKNAYDSSVSEFLIDAAYPLYVSNVKHAARVKIDEEGVEAAAYTEILVAEESAAEPLQIIEFTLDRPFIFAITSRTGDVLFVGTVNNPIE